MRNYLLPALVVGLALAMVGGCAGSEGAAEGRLSEGAPSLEQLGAGVWAALVYEDTAALARFRLSEYEHNELVWPEQPAAQEPAAAKHLHLWWRNIETRNRAGVDDLLRRFAGSGDRIIETRCDGEPRRYETFSALTQCRLVLAQPDGVQRSVEAFRYVIRMDGRHKVVRYYGE